MRFTVRNKPKGKLKLRWVHHKSRDNQDLEL